ncbi:beta-1,4-galactosyltransferase 6 isoform X2 [Coccinella septempunctata]|uniref:beta-1,4-galactosyltransferase 6 isoform X2 n=1 Tax=Coccinella septempunctata TaxID=41139 RepID=UPI001D074C79|nr:beta-1,4-galactosyltransferase 6 isoform X2 [Coccinella septempunctata]
MLCLAVKFGKNISYLIITLAILVGIYFPSRHARHYECVKVDGILRSLHFESSVQNNNLKNCTYENLLSASTNEIRVDDISQQKSISAPSSGGEFIPKDCKPLISSAIIIPYRRREEQLRIFLNFIHHFLQKQKIHYKIYVVDQDNDLPFNRAKLLNIGAKVAMTDGFPCLILHDLDLIPLNYGNIYGCSNIPRHMSCSLDSFRYNLPYLTLFGGAAAILSEQYKRINGMSNLFEGWGGEDDDFYNQNRFDLLKRSIDRRYEDGLNALPNNFTKVLEPLFTHIIVTQ